MPEMTPERIEALAQSAKDRDPDPEPLDMDQPRRLLSATVVCPVGRVDHVGEVEDYEVTDGGRLALYCADDETVIYASGFWSRARVFGGSSEGVAR